MSNQRPWLPGLRTRTTPVPEGDTIFRAARTLDRALSGHAVTKFDTQLSALGVVDQRAPVAGRTVESVAARGKHLLMTLSGDLILRTHMRMHGSWHIYRPGERWRASARDARIVIATTEWVAVAFRVSEAEFLSTRELDHHPRLSALGPDLLADIPDLATMRVRIREAPARHIAEALLRQQSLAGIGNVYKSELLFLSGVHPMTPVSSISDEILDDLVRQARKLLALNVAETSIAGAGRFGRVTTGRLNPREQLWVYGRAGEPCYKCSTLISSASETEGRRTYWCGKCQV